MLRILLADDHDVVRRGLRDVLHEQPGWEVCGEATTGVQAVELAKKLAPDIAVLDVTMPLLNGLDATRQIRKTLPTVEVLIFTMHESEQLIRQVLAAGARGYVLKSDALRHIVFAIDALAHHKPFFSWKVSETMLDSFLRDAAGTSSTNLDPLTPREREIVQLLAESKSSKDISSILGISLKTVETHRATIMRKLGAHSVVEIVHYAIRNKLVQI